MNRYQALFEDYYGDRSWVRFFAETRPDAVYTLEDICLVSGAGWRALVENGTPVTPSSGSFDQAARSFASRRETVVLHALAGSEAAQAQLSIPAVDYLYVSPSSPRTTVSPFREIGRIKTRSGSLWTKLVEARYHYREAPKYGR